MNLKLFTIIWKKNLKKKVLSKDTDSALQENEELFKKYFASVVPAADNKFAALNEQYGQVVRSFMHLKISN